MSQRKRLDTFTRQYIETALWSSNDESDESGGEPLDKNYGIGDIAKSTLLRMAKDCKKFQQAHMKDIISDLGQAGHDFWLNRNGHGAGFWDGDWPEPAATRLDKASKKFGEFYLYVGDDGKIHGSN